MTHDPKALEAELRNLQASALDENFLLRLEAAAHGTLTELSREEIRFEGSLRAIAPEKLSPSFLAEMEKIVRDVPFSLDEKIVLFPKVGAQVSPRRKLPMWSAAAAVALVGAVSALLTPTPSSSQQFVENASTLVPPPRVPQVVTNHLTPASFDRGVSAVKNEGIIWKENNQPHTVVRVVYQDRVTLKDSNGRTFQVEQPRVKYVLVPEQAD